VFAAAALVLLALCPFHGSASSQEQGHGVCLEENGNCVADACMTGSCGEATGSTHDNATRSSSSSYSPDSQSDNHSHTRSVDQLDDAKAEELKKKLQQQKKIRKQMQDVLMSNKLFPKESVPPQTSHPLGETNLVASQNELPPPKVTAITITPRPAPVDTPAKHDHKSEDQLDDAKLDSGAVEELKEKLRQRAKIRTQMEDVFTPKPVPIDTTAFFQATPAKSQTTTTSTSTTARWPVHKPLPPLSPTTSKTILFVAHFFVSTDVNHMLLMADELRARGHNCQFIVMEPYVERVEQMGFQAIATPNVLQGAGLETIQRAFSYTSRESSWLAYVYKYVCGVAPLAAQYYEPAMNIVEDYLHEHGKPDLIIASKASEPAIDVAWHHDIPLSVLYTMPLGGMVNAYEDVVAAPDANLWGSVAQHASLWMRLRKIIGRMAILGNPVTVKVGLQLAHIRYQHGYNPFAIPGDFWKRSIIISPWSIGIDLARPLRPLTQLVGFMTSPQPALPTDQASLEQNFSKDDQDHLTYLNSKTDGVVFCAFGSLAVLTQEWFDDLVAGMDLWARTQKGTNSGGVIAVNDLSLKTGLNVSNVPNTVQVTGWINQKLFLAHPHTKAFITHGGLGSLGEAIQARVPMLVFPLFFDQPNNAHRLEEAGVALKLHFREESITAAKVASRLQRLTSEPNFAHNLNRQYQINERAGGVKKAADLLEDVLLWNGNVDHLIPVNERVSFVQRTNADLYFLIVVLAALLVRNFRPLAQKIMSRLNQKVKVTTDNASTSSRSDTNTSVGKRKKNRTFR